MARTYRANSIYATTPRRLALKVLTRHLDPGTARERFFREGRLAASVNHPNSVYVYGTEEVNGLPVITKSVSYFCCARRVKKVE